MSKSTWIQFFFEKLNLGFLFPHKKYKENEILQNEHQKYGDEMTIKSTTK